MKTPRPLAIITAALLCIASLQSSPAADGVVDISSFAPRDPMAVLRQIELNVSIKQYEKVLMEQHEARLQLEAGPMETGLTDEQQKAWQRRAEGKIHFLDNAEKMLQARILDLVKAANEQAREIEMARKIEEGKARERAGRP